MIYHFQGRSYLHNKGFMKSLRYTTSKLPNNVTVITCSNKESIGLLIPQLKLSNIPYINLVPAETNWDNRLKISYILKALEKVTTEYVLILDAFDVILDNDNLNIIEKFLSFNKELVFNASKNNYPDVQIDTIKNRDALGPFKYFNAGCCVGYTEYAKLFYTECLELIDIENPNKSEQFIVRHVFDKHQNDVGIDSACTIFQTMGHCNTSFEDGMWKIKQS